MIEVKKLKFYTACISTKIKVYITHIINNKLSQPLIISLNTNNVSWLVYPILRIGYPILGIGTIFAPDFDCCEVASR